MKAVLRAGAVCEEVPRLGLLLAWLLLQQGKNLFEAVLKLVSGHGSTEGIKYTLLHYNIPTPNTKYEYAAVVGVFCFLTCLSMVNKSSFLPQNNAGQDVDVNVCTSQRIISEVIPNYRFRNPRNMNRVFSGFFRPSHTDKPFTAHVSIKNSVAWLLQCQTAGLSCCRCVKPTQEQGNGTPPQAKIPVITKTCLVSEEVL